MSHAGLELRRIATQVKETGKGHLPLLSMSARFGVRLRDESEGRAASEDRSGYLVVEPGDIVVNKLSARDGAIGRSSLLGLVSPAYWVLRCAVDHDSRFVAYVLRSQHMQAEIGRVSKFMPPAQYDIAWEDFRSLRIPVPTLGEQRLIANFLDDQVNRIDNIIRGRQAQIALVREAHLSNLRRLTSGSGRSWKVGLAFRTGSGTTPKSDRPEFFDGPIAWVNSGDLNDGHLVQSAKSVTPLALDNYPALKVFQPGALLVAMYGATVGRVARLGIEACVNQAICVLEPLGPISVDYAHAWFFSRRDEIVELAAGGGQPNISQEIIRSLRIDAGDHGWQAARVGEARLATERMLDGIELLERSIRALEEYKRSLTSEVISRGVRASTSVEEPLHV